MWKLWYDKPAAYWEEALPVGNGRLGGMVFGDPVHERIQLNEDTLWSGEPKDCNNPDAPNWIPKIREALFRGDYITADALAKNMQGPFNQSYLPLGDLFVDYDSNAEISDYYRELDLETGVAYTRFTSKQILYEQRVFASYPDQVIAIHLKTNQPGTLNITAWLTSDLRHTLETVGEKTITLRGKAPAHVEPNYRNVEPAIIYDDTPSGKGMSFTTYLYLQADTGIIKSQSDGKLRVTAADSVLLLVSADTSFNGFNRSPSREGINPDSAAQTHLDAASLKGVDRLLIDHLHDHSSLFNRVNINLGPSKDHLPTNQRVLEYQADQDPGLVALIFQYGRYLLMGSSRPGTQPANLQGIWNHEVRPPWSSNWTLNINSEMNYWPVEVCNLSECHQPMLEYIRELAENGYETARINYNSRGWVSHHNGDLWRQSAPVGAFGEGAPQWANFNMSAAWHCMDLWEHYCFNQDQAYLRDFAYPLIKGAAEFCLDWLIPDENGHLVTAPSTSTENSFLTPDGKPAQLSIASTQDMALIWDLFSNCIEASTILELDESFREELKKAQDRLFPYQIGSRGQLQEWSVDFAETDPHHRHLSHLIGMYPGKQITPEKTPELARAVEQSLELRGDDSTGWSMAWKVNLWSRLKKGNRALHLIGYLLRLVENRGTHFTGGGVYPNLFDAHPPFQIDGNFGVTAGIAEMLLQSHRRTPQGGYLIELLPALPDIWKTGSVKGLRARGGITVDIEWKEPGLQQATFTADRDGTQTITYRDQVLSIDLKQGVPRTLDRGVWR